MNNELCAKCIWIYALCIHIYRCSETDCCQHVMNHLVPQKTLGFPVQFRDCQLLKKPLLHEVELTDSSAETLQLSGIDNNSRIIWLLLYNLLNYYMTRYPLKCNILFLSLVIMVHTLFMQINLKTYILYFKYPFAIHKYSYYIIS